MMRNKPASSMQKTYDECYLMCSTAVFFEGQNNEAEALRSWRSALDQIYYHNAYRLPSGYVPRTETEKALYDSLKQLELQCKERVDLLEALKQSRKEAGREERPEYGRRKLEKAKPSAESLRERTSSWLGDETVPPLQLSDLPNAAPALPVRPGLSNSRSSDAPHKDAFSTSSQAQSSPLGVPPTLPVPSTKVSRSPSPDHGRKTMRTTLRGEKKNAKPPRSAPSQNRRADTMKAAGLAWDALPRRSSQISQRAESDPTIEARLGATAARRSLDHDPSTRADEPRKAEVVRIPESTDDLPPSYSRDPLDSSHMPSSINHGMENLKLDPAASTMDNLIDFDTPPLEMPILPTHTASLNPFPPKMRATSPTRQPMLMPMSKPTPLPLPKPPEITYRKEYLTPPSKASLSAAHHSLDPRNRKNSTDAAASSSLDRKPGATSTPTVEASRRSPGVRSNMSESDEDLPKRRRPERSRRPRSDRRSSSKTVTPPSTDADSPEEDTPERTWERKVASLLKHLPKGVDEGAAGQILNEIVVKGDEVHWDDVAGLDAAKKALKEAVVYPFLRPDLFMGLREPARGMLLFGPPGTGKTMLARAVATESKSCFFAISASSLTSKWHGESEKLVRALFALAKSLAPSIIFVDEIDSLLSARSGSSEHEASRRTKTEFLIQWSDLQRAAAGRDPSAGDPSRVLVLAATNCPWDIDDAARRRFVRRQYIPLPEAETRETQIRILLGHQKHELSAEDISRLVQLTEGYSGSDITALAKDAAMGPLRNLGEALLYTPKEQIRPIRMEDFEASLASIRPSVSKKGLQAFEKWAREFGERGG